MELRQLRFFLSTLRQGSIKGAAKEHFVTQPAVSIQLKKLEEEVGEKLYMRRGRRIVPTEAGSVIANYAEDIIQRIDQMSSAVKALKGLEQGTLRLGNIDAASIYVLPSVFRSFQRKYPGIDIHVVVADSDSLLSALESGSLELAIVTLPIHGEGLVTIPIYKDPMVLVANPRHELVTSRASRRRPLQTVARTGLITYPAQSTTRRLIEKVFLDNELSFRASMEMSSPEAIKRLTEAGLGASILPQKVVADEVRRGTLEIISTGKVKFHRMLGVVHRDRGTFSPPAAAFLDMLIGKYQRGTNQRKV